MRTGNLIHFGQRTVNHWPALNLNVSSFVYNSIFVLFGFWLSPIFLCICVGSYFYLFNLFPSSSHLNLFISMNFSLVGLQVAAYCYTGGTHKSDPFRLEEIASLPGMHSLHLDLGQSLFRVKPMFRWDEIWQDCVRIFHIINFKTSFNISIGTLSKTL